MNLLHGRKTDGEPCAWNRARWNPATRPVSIQRWRKLAEATNEFLDKGRQVFVEGELRGDAVEGSQNLRIWTGNDGEHRASYEVTARMVKFIGRKVDNGSVPVGGPPPEGHEDDDALLF
jgi:single-stranded DNA-binding protein